MKGKRKIKSVKENQKCHCVKMISMTDGDEHVSGQNYDGDNSYGTHSLTYDDGGRVTLVTEPNSLTPNFGYDKAGNRTLVTDSLGGTEMSTYDAANFLTSRMYQGQGQILGVQFTNNAEDWNTTLARYGNGTLIATGETTYDNVGQATTILNTHGTATVDQFLNAYNNGNVTSVIGTQNGSTTTLGLTYDEDNELTGAGTTSYTFDSNGNRTGSAGVTTGNELTSDATWSYTYDADGNLIQKSKGVGGTIITIGLGGGGGGGVGILGGGETWTYGYNPQDQLTQVQHFTGPLVTLALTVDYDYDAFGNRIETTSIASGTTTVTKDAYDGWDPGQPAPTGNENFNVWAQTNASGTLTSRYMYSDRVDQQLGRIDVTAGTATIYWTLEDYQNSVRDVIDNTGALKDSIQYDAYGNITSETDPTYRGSYAWTGRELDAETDLQYNHARWYDATTGRWMTRDPLGFDAGDSNLYRYVKNEPTEAADPSGLQVRGRPLPPGPVVLPDVIFNAIAPPKQQIDSPGGGGVSIVQNVTTKDQAVDYAFAWKVNEKKAGAIIDRVVITYEFEAKRNPFSAFFDGPTYKEQKELVYWCIWKVNAKGEVVQNNGKEWDALTSHAVFDLKLADLDIPAVSKGSLQFAGFARFVPGFVTSNAGKATRLGQDGVPVQKWRNNGAIQHGFIIDWDTLTADRINGNRDAQGNNADPRRIVIPVSVVKKWPE